MTIPGVVAETFALDWMHILCLGICHHVVANVCFELVYFELPGTLDVKMETLFAEILEQYELLQIPHDRRLNIFKLENFCEPKSPHQSYPTLKQVKAAETRALVPVMHKLCQKHQTDSNHSKHRTACLNNLNKMYETILRAGTFLNQDEKASLRNSTFAFLAHYMWLAHDVAQLGRLLWSTVPKFHYCCHLPDQADFINPRLTWSYGGESMVGLIVKLGHACLRSTPAHMVFVSLCSKYRSAMHVQISCC